MRPSEEAAGKALYEKRIAEWKAREAGRHFGRWETLPEESREMWVQLAKGGNE